MTKRQALFWWIGVSAALMLIGAFGPWVKALAVSVSGTDGSNDGWIVVVSAIVAAAVTVWRRERRSTGVVVLVAGLIGAATTIYDHNNVASKIHESGALAQALVRVGWGLNLAMIASISLAIVGLIWLLSSEAGMAAPARFFSQPSHSDSNDTRDHPEPHRE